MVLPGVASTTIHQKIRELVQQLGGLQHNTFGMCAMCSHFRLLRAEVRDDEEERRDEVLLELCPDCRRVRRDYPELWRLARTDPAGWLAREQLAAWKDRVLR